MKMSLMRNILRETVSMGSTKRLSEELDWATDTVLIEDVGEVGLCPRCDSSDIEPSHPTNSLFDTKCCNCGFEWD